MILYVHIKYLYYIMQLGRGWKWRWRVPKSQESIGYETEKGWCNEWSSGRWWWSKYEPDSSLRDLRVKRSSCLFVSASLPVLVSFEILIDYRLHGVVYPDGSYRSDAAILQPSSESSWSTDSFQAFCVLSGGYFLLLHHERHDSTHILSLQ